MHAVHALRRTIAAAILAVIAYLAGKDHWLEHHFGSFAKVVSLVVLIVAVLVVIWLILNPNSIGTIVAFFIGCGAFWFCEHEFELKTAIDVVLIVAIVAGLWAAIVPDGSAFNVFNRTPRRAPKA